MNDALICKCQFCSKDIEYDPPHAGQLATCPFCQLETLLAVPPRAVPPYIPFFRRRLFLGYAAAFGTALIFLIGVAWVASELPEDTGAMIISLIGAIVGGIFILFLYFIPALVAHNNKKKNFTAILILNIFAGWTFIGWVVALVWAVTKD